MLTTAAVEPQPLQPNVKVAVKFMRWLEGIGAQVGNGGKGGTGDSHGRRKGQGGPGTREGIERTLQGVLAAEKGDGTGMDTAGQPVVQGLLQWCMASIDTRANVLTAAEVQGYGQ